MTSYVSPSGAAATQATPREEGGHDNSGHCVDVGRVLDDGPFTTIQKIVVLLAALSIVFDGFDSQLIGFAIPVLIRDWGIARTAFVPVVAAGLIGMGIGSAGFVKLMGADCRCGSSVVILIRWLCRLQQ